ncbi:hypothetical protein L1987_57175 [Smallanthus sonchifolius]|uniref:Uncharacterized protein n=1 Tax=Smallanthus sonchifolius TaxID=185202 RepID=A0ACB9DCB4_9ASTR|nr:hypothetical protein L1987_57175 [Smallanthus sonchifolius]
MPTSTSNKDLLESARPFLREDNASVDKNLPTLLTILRSAGAGECWHRLGTFSDHLYHVYRILKLWKATDSVCLFGLFHSVYSNSYHDLAIFNPETDRETVRHHVGPVAESLIHLFCIVPRHTLIHDDLVFRYTDAELREHLQASEQKAGGVRKEENWRKKLQEIVGRSWLETCTGRLFMTRSQTRRWVKCIEMNPFVGEPHVLLSQFYVSRERFEEGEREGEVGLGLLLEWGCPWDKRVSWEGWVAWCRVVLSKAKERSWPHTSWGIISLGLVK